VLLHYVHASHAQSYSGTHRGKATRLRHRATSQNVAGSRPDEVTDFLQLPSSLQPHHASRVDSACKINEYRSISGSKARPACKAHNLTAIYKPTVYTMWDPPGPVTRIALFLRVVFIMCNVSYIVLL
jgi:hypothetical protein